MDADLTLEKDRARLSRNNRQWSEEQRARLQMSTTSIVTNSNVSTAEREPSSSADPFLLNRGNCLHGGRCSCTWEDSRRA